MRVAPRFKLGSIEGPKKSGFGPYATPPKRLRIFETTVRDQEVLGLPHVFRFNFGSIQERDK